MKRLSLITLSLGVLILPFITLWSQGYVFGPNIRVSDYAPGTAYAYTANAGQRGVAVRGDTVYCVWDDNRFGGDWTVWFSKSIDGGQTFSANVQVDDGLGEAYTPTLAMGDYGTIYVAWDGEPPPFTYKQVFFSKSTDGGITFTPDVLVNDTAGGIKNRPHREPSMTVDTAGVIYIAFDDARIYDYDIYFSKSIDGGVTFTQDVLVNDTMSDTLFDLLPALALNDDGDIYISWSKQFDSLFVSKSTDGGVTFGPDILVNDTITESWQNTMDVDARGYVHIAWFDRRDDNYNIYYSRSMDGGMTFSSNIRVNGDANEPGPQSSPSMCVDDTGMVYAVWQDGPATNPDIYFTFSTDIGDSIFFEPNVEVDDTDSSCYYPSLAIDDSSNVYVLWVDFRNGWPQNEVYFSVGRYESGIFEEKGEGKRNLNATVSISPNPFSKSITINLGIYDEGYMMYDTELNIYDMSGRLVKQFIISHSEFPIPNYVWDGTDQEGKTVPAGIYFIKATIGTTNIRAKVIKVK